MTKAIEQKVVELKRTTSKYMARVKTHDNAPFATSAAKYYPALKKLASK